MAGEGIARNFGFDESCGSNRKSVYKFSSASVDVSAKFNEAFTEFGGVCRGNVCIGGFPAGVLKRVVQRKKNNEEQTRLV